MGIYDKFLSRIDPKYEQRLSQLPRRLRNNDDLWLEFAIFVVGVVAIIYFGSK